MLSCSWPLEWIHVMPFRLRREDTHTHTLLLVSHGENSTAASIHCETAVCFSWGEQRQEWDNWTRKDSAADGMAKWFQAEGRQRWDIWKFRFMLFAGLLEGQRDGGLLGIGGETAWEQDSLEDPLCFALLLPCRLWHSRKLLFLSSPSVWTKRARWPVLLARF